MRPRLVAGHPVLLAPAFGTAIALCFAAGWSALDRAFTVRILYALLFIAVSGTVSAGLAMLLGRAMRGRPWTSRFSAAVILLIVGTVGLSSFLMMLRAISSHHDLTEAPPGMIAAILVISTAAAIHNFLVIAGPLMLPLALPLIALVAYTIAQSPR